VVREEGKRQKGKPLAHLVDGMGNGSWVERTGKEGE